MGQIKIAPSIFAADFINLSNALTLCENSKVDMIHFDVMDNHFVPNISFGPKFIDDICSKTAIPADVHLMIDLDNIDKLNRFLKLPAGSITIHLESNNDKTLDYLDKIKSSGKSAGLSIKPSTPVGKIVPFIPMLDMVLLMSVEPGFSGQEFMPAALGRMEKLKEITSGKEISLQVDGGISRSNLQKIVRSGADFLVLGSAFFKDEDPESLVNFVHGMS